MFSIPWYLCSKFALLVTWYLLYSVALRSLLLFHPFLLTHPSNCFTMNFHLWFVPQLDQVCGTSFNLFGVVLNKMKVRLFVLDINPISVFAKRDAFGLWFN